jgi:putative ABC transport system permease protein
LQRLIPDQREVRKVAIIRLYGGDTDLREVIHRVEKKVTSHNLHQFKSLTEILADGEKCNQKVFLIFNALATLIGIVGLMIVTYRMIQERRRQLGVLRVIGIRPKVFVLSMVTEGTIIGLIGMTLGVIVGFYTSYLMLQALFLNTPQVNLDEAILHFPYLSIGTHYIGGLY